MTKWLERKWVQFLLLTCAFALVYALNNSLTDSLRLVPGAHLVHIPSGIKLLMVLIFELTGALSIAAVSLLAGLLFYFPDSPGVSLQLALANALAPFLTLKLLIARDNFDEWISGLSKGRLIAMGLVFATLNSALNQLVIYWNGVTDDIVSGLGVMFIGDITGVYITLLLLKLISHVLRQQLVR
jgi:hypothetical protein